MVSAQLRYVGRKLRLIRLVLTSAATVGAATCTAICYAPASWSLYPAVLTVLTGAAIPVELVKEFLSGAGSYQEAEYKRGETFYREFTFRPFIRGLSGLAAALAIATVSIIIGYAAIYSVATSAYQVRFSQVCDGNAALYFSVITFATVGYGDITPSDAIGRWIVASQIIVCWCFAAVAIGILVSWIIAIEQRTRDRKLAARERDMQALEQAMKAAGVGLYGNSAELLEEARRRVRER